MLGAQNVGKSSFIERITCKKAEEFSNNIISRILYVKIKNWGMLYEASKLECEWIKSLYAKGLYGFL